MPRAKVHPDARRRVVQACRQCKTSKRKCNASLPCNHCIKRGIADECDLSDTGSNRRSSVVSKSQTERRKSTASRIDRPSPERPGANSQNSELTLVNDSYSQGLISDNVTSHGSLNESSPDLTRPQMLSNNEGEYVFVGRSASLSFLQLVRETVARCIGPSEFSEYARQGRMLEVDLEIIADSSEEIALTSDQKQHCIDSYSLATNGLIDVLSLEEAKKLFSYKSSEINSYLVATRLLVIAIGAQTGSTAMSLPDNLEKRAFAQARMKVFTSMLENPNLDMIRVFLLLAFYLLGACHRNAAFLYLGIASRAAHALGLHTSESYTILGKGRQSIQLKCWKSLVSLDLMVSSILGRTTAILAQGSSTESTSQVVDRLGNYQGSEQEAVYQLALLVDMISSQFNSHEAVTATKAQTHLQSLKDWSCKLPPKLRPATIPETCDTETRRSMVGCMHLSCFYYFAVMLVTRPFLIIHITRRLVSNNGPGIELAIADSVENEELASACLNAATYMAQTCGDMLDHELLADNMCLLKAWIFTAGLVIGFELFARRGVALELEQAFTSCSRVLHKISAKSPQAAQYHEILTHLSSAIERHKQMQKPRQSQNGGSLVARIMDLRPQNETSTLATPYFAELNGMQDPTANLLTATLMDNALGDSGQAFENNNFSTAMDDFSLPFADSFWSDLQNFGMMPWGLS